MVTLYHVLLLAGLVAGAPKIGFPINAQVPPVARVSEPFSFTFAQSTFISEPDSTSYILTDHPAWLALDGSHRTLWGIPGASDVGAPVITLTTTDGSGSQSMRVTLIVDSSPAPEFQGNMSAQLSKVGVLSGKTAVTLKPSIPFSLAFPPDIFSSNGKNVTYYATSVDRTPLPSWLAFDNAAIRFSGTTPQLTAYPQRFDLLLIVSDYVGFSGASTTFSLVISNHILAFAPEREQISVTPGTALSVTDLFSHLLLDNSPINEDDLQDATFQGPSWLSFDPKSLDIIGLPPPDVQSQDILVSVTDRFSDQTNATVRLQVGTDLFNGKIGTLNATAGIPFNYTISRDIFARSDVRVSLDLGDLNSWLIFDADTLRLHGIAPSTLPTQDHSATLAASASGAPVNSTQIFTIHVKASSNNVSSGTRPSPSTSMTTSSSAPTSTSSQGIGYYPNGRLSHKGEIIAVLVPVLVVSVLLLLAVGLVSCRKKRRMQRRSKALRDRDISRPVMQETSLNQDIPSDQEEDVEWGSAHSQLTDDGPPQVDVAIPTRSASQAKNRQSAGSTLGERESQILADFNRSYRPTDSMRIANELARLSRGDANSNPMAQALQSPKRESHPPLQNPVARHRRITSINYGRYSLTSPSHGRGHGRASMREPGLDAISSSSYSTQSTGLLCPTPSSFPVPPNPKRLPSLNTKFADPSRHTKRPSVASIGSDTGFGTPNVLPDRRTMDEKRQTYMPHRAGRRSPFFAAGGPSSRASSLSRQRSHLISGTSTLTSPILTPTTESFEGSKRSTMLQHTISQKRKSRELLENSTDDTSSEQKQPLRNRSKRLRPAIAPGFPRVVSNRLSRASSNAVYEDVETETRTQPSRPPSSLYSHSSSNDELFPSDHNDEVSELERDSNWETLSHSISLSLSPDELSLISPISGSAAPSIPPRSPARPQSSHVSNTSSKRSGDANRSRSAISIEKMKAAAARNGRTGRERREDMKKLRRKAKERKARDGEGEQSSPIGSGKLFTEQQDVGAGAEQSEDEVRVVSTSMGNEAFL